jgi:SAM-dependent methyltransferase
MLFDFAERPAPSICLPLVWYVALQPSVTQPVQSARKLTSPRAHAQAYEAAIARAVQRKAVADGAAHVLDLGTGTGLLALMAARAGAASVVACDLLAPLVAAARQAWTLHLPLCVTACTRCMQVFSITREPVPVSLAEYTCSDLFTAIHGPLSLLVSRDAEFMGHSHCLYLETEKAG